MATKRNTNPRFTSMEHKLSEAMQQLGVASVNDLEARKNGFFPTEDAKRLGKAEEKANIIVQAAFEDTMRKIQSGEFQDPKKWDFGDGDQSHLPSPNESAEAQKLKSLWAMGGDYSWEAPHMSQWMKDCFYGKLDKIKIHLEEEPQLLDRRESLLRLNGLMHVIQGFRQNQSGNHLDCVRYLLEKGTPVDSKDFLGHTPLHQCTGAFGNKNLCKIAKILLEKGADINIENRFGCSPLVEPSFALNMYCVNWLLDNGADPFKAKSVSGQTLYEGSRLIPPLREAVDKYMCKFVKSEKQKASTEASYRSCAVCKKETEIRCSGCFLSWYCTKKCQLWDWDDHKKECKTRKGEYVSFKLKLENFNMLMSASGSQITTLNATGGAPCKKKSHCTVKIQAGEGHLLVYNEKKTILGSITHDMPHYREVREQIRNHGVGGRKAYFYAKWNWKEGEGLKINIKRVQPPETW